MPRPIWFRSLYWRIALGFVAMLAALLLVQGMLFLWLTGRFALSTASRTPQQLVDQVARELSEALTENPALDVPAFVTAKYGDVTQGFAVMMRDGRRAINRPGVLPPGFGERLRRPPPMDPGGGPERGDRFGDRDRFGERMGPPPQEPGTGPGAPPSGNATVLHRTSCAGVREAAAAGPAGRCTSRPSSSAARRWAWSPLRTDRHRSRCCCASSVRR